LIKREFFRPHTPGGAKNSIIPFLFKNQSLKIELHKYLLTLPTIFGITKLECRSDLMPLSGKEMLKLYEKAGWIK